MAATSTPDITVFIARRDVTCGECGEPLGRHAWITLDRERGALCLACADLDHLVFLPAGDTALTRRAKKHSTLSAVVLEWSRARERYERQGLLVEEAGLAQAEQECLADADARERRRAREVDRRAEEDQEYAARFAAAVRELYPGCPSGRETVIAEHACRKYSGRSAGARWRSGWTPMPCAWRSSHTCATPKRTTTSFSAKATTVGTREWKSKDKQLACWDGGRGTHSGSFDSTAVFTLRDWKSLSQTEKPPQGLGF
jgi:hypothetical protein